MGPRAKLHDILVQAIGSNHVYFQPPESVKMIYPCIVYELTGDSPKYADGLKYVNHANYTVTIIDKDPDSKIPDRLRDLPYFSFNRHYTSDNLHHYSFKAYY